MEQYGFSELCEDWDELDLVERVHVRAFLAIGRYRQKIRRIKYRKTIVAAVEGIAAAAIVYLVFQDNYIVGYTAAVLAGYYVSAFSLT